VPNNASMSERLDRRLATALTELTLRRAVGLIVTVATTLALVAAILVRLVDPAIGTFSDALWWAISTVTTVGYGDVIPESAAGRLVATGLMLTGLGLIPLITSVVVSILVSQRSREAREEELRDLNQILDRLDAIDRRLAALEPRR
jgi:voltage-gated potassium channel